MGHNAIFFGWNRSIPGREQISAEHFQEFTDYLAGLEANGAITSFEAVFLVPHGGDLNGFFLLRGDTAKLDALVTSQEWIAHQMRAALHLEGSGSVRGHVGAAVMDIFSVWSQIIPS